MIGEKRKKTILHHRWFEKYSREEKICLFIRSVSFIIFDYKNVTYTLKYTW